MTKRLDTHPCARTSFVLTLAAVWALAAAGCSAGNARRAAATPEPARERAPEVAWRVIGSYSTVFSLDQSERSVNIRLAASRLDGATIGPGETFSFNTAVGPRQLGGGWRLAPALVLEGARLSVGGGICQVSSTVYNATLLGDLRLVERHAHTRPVRYIPLGRDATVSWGSKDLRMRNPHDFSVRLRTSVRHDRLVVELLAPARLAYEVRLETADAEPASPRLELQVLENPDRLAVGGVWVKLYRHRLRRGSVYQSERIGRSSFYPYKIPEPDP